jgi:predicted RNA-binding protein with PUA-like domain
VLARQITLQELRAHHQQHAGAGGPLAAMALFNRPRLSVQPVTAAEWEFVLSLEEQRAGGSAKQG